MSKINDEMFDLRHSERYLQEDRDKPASEQKYLKALTEYLANLEDCSDNVEQSSIVMVAHDRHRRVVYSEEGVQDEDEG
ncbi:MAG: hypothetical protein Q8P18_26195 [Pseudomonadota bacterium]|nr:hypothetical protein [Pseudomonadota bacterium]